MAGDILVVFLSLSGLLLLVWCFLGFLLRPVFCEEMVTYLPVTGDGEGLELRVHAYAWLREGRISGGKLVLVDRGLNETGAAVAERLCKEYKWLLLEQASNIEI